MPSLTQGFCSNGVTLGPNVSIRARAVPVRIKIRNTAPEHYRTLKGSDCCSAKRYRDTVKSRPDT